MNKIITVITVLIAATAMAAAQNKMVGLFNTMPASWLTYLDASERQSLADSANAKGRAVVVNNLGDSTAIEAVGSNYLRLKCNKAHTMEMMLLKRTTEKDSVVCLVSTFKGPAKESTVAFFDTRWNRLSGNLAPTVTAQQLLHKPDTMTDTYFNSLVENLDPQLVAVSVSPKEQALTYTVSIPEVPKDKIRQLKGILLQRKFKWNGEKFN